MEWCECELVCVVVGYGVDFFVGEIVVWVFGLGVVGELLGVCVGVVVVEGEVLVICVVVLYWVGKCF